MSDQPSTTPVADSVPKVGGELAVGENLDFQRRWWTFERVIWPVFLVVILCDAIGLFGHGWLSKARLALPNGALGIDYEWVERSGTPSTMTLHFGPRAIRDGKIQLYISDSVIQELGAQRIAPQPLVSAIGEDGINYTFPATGSPAEVQIQMEPARIGSHVFRIALPHQAPLEARILVLP